MNNPEKCREHYKKYRNKNKKKRSLYWKERYSRFLLPWEGFIPEKTKCEICGKDICFNQRNSQDAIRFDHKKENIVIKGKPSNWLCQNKRTVENEKIWKSCDFGMLCNKCNLILPVKNRKRFVKKIYKYVFRSSQ